MQYKETIKLELKHAVQRFNRSKNTVSKTHTIEKKLMKKKYMRQTFNYYQKLIKDKSPEECHVFNFYNILIINEESIRNRNHHESHIKSYFYYKNIKKIETTENYIIVFLQNNYSLECPIAQFISRYKKDPDVRFRKIGQMLEDIEKNLEMNKQSSSNSSTLNQEAAELLNNLGKTPFIAKVGCNQLIVSKSIMEMFGYQSQEFLIECIKFRIPPIEGFGCTSYYEVVVKSLQNLALLMELLNGRIPLKTFEQMSYFQFQQKINSKNNIQYNCKLSLSMPVPLIGIIKVEEILDMIQKPELDGSMMANYRNFKHYYEEIRQKQYKTLQHLTTLPTSILPQNKSKVANYQCLYDEEKTGNSTQSK